MRGTLDPRCWPERTRFSSAARALLIALAASAVVAPTCAASAVFTVTGKSFVLSTPEWTLMSPLSDTKGGGPGVFINDTFFYTFSAPKNKGPKSKDGTTVKRAFFLRFRRLVLTPATVAASGPQPSASGDRILLSLAVKLSKGSLSPQTAGAMLRVQASSSPYEVTYSGATLLTASSGIKFVGAKPWIRVGKSKRFKITTSGATFQLATTGTATALCASGFGGTLGTASATKSGCVQCPAGSYASKSDQTTPCKLCSSLGPTSYAPQAGAAACQNCTAGQTANVNGTACTAGSAPTKTVTASFVLTVNGPCSTAATTQIKANQETFLNSQPGVQSATANVTCTQFQARRRSLLAIRSADIVNASCTGPSAEVCNAAFAALNDQLQSCCKAINTSCPKALAPAGCLSASQATCGTNFYLKNGVCTPCGNGANAAAGQSVTCGCKGTGVEYNTTADKCVCSGASFVYKEGVGCTQPLYPANATCADVDGAGPGNDTFSGCGAGKQYDAIKGNNTVAGFVINGTLSADACCSPLYPANATCADVSGAGLGQSTFSSCGTGTQYDASKGNTSIAGLIANGAQAAGACCSAIYPLGATCGNMTATNAPVPFSSCPTGRTYNASRSATSIGGYFLAQAAAQCCVYATGSTCGNIGGSTFPSVECSAGKKYNDTLSNITIAGDVVAEASPKCCS